mmetsp:Transcript_2823/g.8319  ORF Transcript_2823/g.8319 Transcript_2823/m.8319 type:complete len:88 (+) Transcript_2823:302-565(+)
MLGASCVDIIVCRVLWCCASVSEESCGLAVMMTLAVATTPFSTTAAIAYGSHPRCRLLRVVGSWFGGQADNISLKRKDSHGVRIPVE